MKKTALLRLGVLALVHRPFFMARRFFMPSCCSPAVLHGSPLLHAFVLFPALPASHCLHHDVFRSCSAPAARRHAACISPASANRSFGSGARPFLSHAEISGGNRSRSTWPDSWRARITFASPPPNGGSPVRT